MKSAAPMWQKIIAVFLFVAFGLASVLLIARYVQVVHFMEKTSDWVRVPATIETWNVVSHSSGHHRKPVHQTFSFFLLCWPPSGVPIL